MRVGRQADRQTKRTRPRGTQVGRPTSVLVGGKQAHRQTDKTNRQTGKQTDKEVCRQGANRQTDRQTDKTKRLAGKQAGRQTNKCAGRGQTDKQMGKQKDNEVKYRGCQGPPCKVCWQPQVQVFVETHHPPVEPENSCFYLFCICLAFCRSTLTKCSMLLVLGNDGYETGILVISKQCTMLSQLAHKTDKVLHSG